MKADCLLFQCDARPCPGVGSGSARRAINSQAIGVARATYIRTTKRRRSRGPFTSGLLTAVSCFLLTTCSHTSNHLQPKIKPLMEAVYASGFVVAQDEYKVFSTADGYLLDKLVTDGATVKRGDPLFVLEGQQQSARYTMARKNYDLAARNNSTTSPVLAELTASVEAARTKMRFDSVNAARYASLWAQKATTHVDYDRMKLAYENSLTTYQAQRSRLATTQNQLDLELQNAKSQLLIAGDEAGRSIIRSEADGKVFQTLKEKGELVRRGELAAIVGNDKAFYLQLSVDELDAQRIREGQAVLVKIDAYPNTVFDATVTKVYPMINKQQQSIRVDAALKQQLPGGFSGLALEANIVVQQKQRAMVIPKTALLPGDSVAIKTDDGVRKVKVLKGIETLDEVEIVEGLDTTRTLIVQR